MLDHGPVADTALVGVVDEIIAIVEDHVKTCAVDRNNFGAQMIQQGFDFAPVDVVADRIMEDGAQQVAVFVAHDELLESVLPDAQYHPLLRQGKA